MEEEFFYLGNNKKSTLGLIEKKTKYNNDEYVFDINRKDDGHSAVARQIKPKSLVLDIGCADGLTGRLLKKALNCTIDGIECDSESIENAKKSNCYRNLYNFSITDNSNKGYIDFINKKEKYDYIVFCDVLEHLDKPWEVIYEVSKLLKPTGAIIVSLPNIAHIDIIKNLINQNFNYNNLGLLDSTHIRFFTKQSFFDMIDNIGQTYNKFFDVKVCDRVVIKPSYIDNSRIYELFEKCNNSEDFYTLQYIFKLTLNKKKKILSKSENNISNFKNINELLEKEILKLQKLKEENEILNQKLIESQLEKERLQATLNQIFDSKRWRVMNKILNHKKTRGEK